MGTISNTIKECMKSGEGVAFPCVSVIVLTYGKFDGLKRTLTSIMKQTCPIKLILVSDDGSGQNIPPALQKQFPAIQFLENKENLGTVAHMNRMAAQTQSEYLKFMAEGDAFSDSEALKALVVFAKGTNASVVASQSMVCTKGLRRQLYQFPGNRSKWLQEKSPEVFRRLSLSNFISAPATLFHHSFFTQLGGFDENYHLLEDWPTWLRLIREGYSIPFLNRVTCLYEVGGVSSENFDAYGSKCLQKDMLQCYEREILPYRDLFSESEKKTIQFYYNQLSNTEIVDLLKNYFWLEMKTLVKRAIKRYLLY